jgi:hypothetical protein
MARFTNKTINVALGELRTNIREGKTIVYFRNEGVEHLKRLIVAALGGEANSDAWFSKEFFNPQTLRRFEKLFDVPTYIMVSGSNTYPTQDDTATALQNFINRRSDPWAHVRPSTSDLEAAAMLNS